MENFVRKIEEKNVLTSDEDDIPFKIHVDYLNLLIESIESISAECEFLS